MHVEDVVRCPRRGRLVRRGHLVRAQAVHHQHHPLGFRMPLLHQPAQHLGETLGRPRAGRGDQAGLGAAVQLPLPTGAVLLLAGQGGSRPVLDEPLADPGDGIGTDLHGVSGPLVVPSRAPSVALALRKTRGG